MNGTQTAPALSVKEVAESLAKENGESDEQITVIRWFPSESEIRLIVVDPATPPVEQGERVAPFYFGADEAGGIPYRSAIAVVSVEDDGKAPLPDGWVGWSDSREVWRRAA